MSSKVRAASASASARAVGEQLGVVMAHHRRARAATARRSRRNRRDVEHVEVMTREPGRGVGLAGGERGLTAARLRGREHDLDARPPRARAPWPSRRVGKDLIGHARDEQCDRGHRSTLHGRTGDPDGPHRERRRDRARRGRRARRARSRPRSCSPSTRAGFAVSVPHRAPRSARRATTTLRSTASIVSVDPRACRRRGTRRRRARRRAARSRPRR